MRTKLLQSWRICSATCSKEAIGADLPNPFPRLTYDEAMHRFGSDKPDLRVTLELTEITDAVKDVPSGLRQRSQQREWPRRSASHSGGASLTRGEIDAYGTFVAIYGAKGTCLHQVNDASQLNEKPAVPDRQKSAMKQR